MDKKTVITVILTSIIFSFVSYYIGDYPDYIMK